ncbi:MAG: hypothetical protein FJ088_01975 [Deltaproteobacteria bacterium]|nr:hypothetical protein [Deltaproteobacteria bacterium]
MLFILAGCFETGGSDIGVNQEDAFISKGANVCESDADCDSGQYCSKELNACLSSSENLSVFSVQLTPPADTGLLADQYSGIKYSEVFNVVISEPVTVSGDVRKKSTGELVGGTLIARSDGQIPGTSFSHQAPVKSAKKSEAERAFTIKLTPNRVYSIFFVPEDSTIPPYTTSWSFVSNAEKDIELPPESEYTIIAGQVVTDTNDLTGIEGAKVYGFAEDGSIISSSAITDKNGYFKILYPKQKTFAPMVLKIEPTKNSSIKFPTMVYSDIQKLKDNPNILSIDDKIIIPVGPLPPEMVVEIQVVGKVDEALSPPPVAFASVKMTADIGNGTVYEEFKTDKNGIFSGKLLSGRYEISVFPPENSKYASFTMILDLKENVEDTYKYSIFAEQRKRLDGKVTGVKQKAIEWVEVIAITSAPLIGDQSQYHSVDRVFSAVTNADGEFSMLVDPGSYMLTFVPRPNSGYPKDSGYYIAVEEDGFVTAELHPGNLIKGKVRNSNGASLAEVEIEFFREGLFDAEFPYAYTISGSSYLNYVLGVGSAVTDAAGDYFLVLPSYDFAKQGSAVPELFINPAGKK